ncbi:MAG: FxsA family protein [Pseudomonadota bacterium]
MRFGLLLMFIAVPLAELALLIKLGGWIGIWPTLAIILLTAVVGTALLRQQGLNTLAKVGQSVNAGKAPVVPVVEGVLLLISGAFLLTPGVITDLVGGLMLIAPLRGRLAEQIVQAALSRGLVHVNLSPGMGRQAGPDASGAPWPETSKSPPGAGPRAGPGTGPGTGPRAGRGSTGGRPSRGFGPAPNRRPDDAGDIIDGDFERLDEKTIDPNRRR